MRLYKREKFTPVDVRKKNSKSKRDGPVIHTINGTFTRGFIIVVGALGQTHLTRLGAKVKLIVRAIATPRENWKFKRLESLCDQLCVWLM